MGFDLSTAKPVSAGGFDLSTAKPEGTDAYGIPGVVREAPKEEPRSLFERAMGNIETIPAMAAGTVSGIVAPIAGVYGALTSGKYGTQEGIREGEKVAQQVQQQFYQPRTPEAQRNMAAIGEVTNNFVGVVPTGKLSTVGTLASPAIAPVAASAKTAVANKVAPIVAKRAAQASEADWQKAALLDTLTEAKTLPHKISFNPLDTNPTIGNKTVGVLAGREAVDNAAIKANTNQWGNNAKADMGLHKDVPLTSVKPFQAIRTRASAPYKEISKIERMVDDGAIEAKINSIEIPDLISDPNASRVVNSMVGRAIDRIKNGMSGAEVLEQIKQLRADADNTVSAKAKGVKVDPSDTAKANASLQLASALEDFIDNNVPANNPQLVKQLKKARYEIKKSYDYQNATDLDTGLLDPSKLPDTMEGIGGTMRKIAANVPATSKVSTAPLLSALDKVTRTGISGAVGAVLGSGTPVGPVGGALLGSAAGKVGGTAYAKRVVSPEYQTKNVFPTDRRMFPTEEAAPVVPIPQLGAEGYIPPTPFREAPPNAPNFTMGGKPDPVVTATGVQMDVPQLGYRTASDYVLERQARASEAARAADAQQAAAEASRPRAPTGGGMVLDLDPITGRLVPADRGVKGATPEVFQANTGASLSAAAEKVAAGKKFDLTAAEKVAWDKTAVDIKQISSEFNSLSPKQVAEKMADRQWVQEAINKANQKAEMFAQMEQKSLDVKAQSLARINREKMLDIAEQLQEALGGRPSSRGYAQGPKTRAFQRGLLSGDGQ